jgi:hypothetical protein
MFWDLREQFTIAIHCKLAGPAEISKYLGFEILNGIYGVRDYFVATLFAMTDR